MNKIKFIIERDLSVSTVLVLLLILSQYPYVFASIFNLPEQNVVNIAFTVLFLIVFVCLKRVCTNTIPTPIVFSIVVQTISWAIYSSIHNDNTYYTRVFLVLETLIVLLCLIKNNSIYRFNRLYTGFITLQVIGGFGGFVLIAMGILPVAFEFFLGDTRPSSCYIITCSNMVMGNIARVSGYFDEPGALAFWGVYALLANKLFVNNKKIEITLMIGLLSTLSAAYFLVLPLYIVLFYTKDIKKSILTISLLLSLGYVAMNYLGSNEDFRYMTTERFEGGQIRSKRELYAEQAEKVYKANPIFGIGSKELENLSMETNDNPYEILAKDGTVGFIVTYMPLILCLLYFYKEREVLCAGAILFTDYMQRPFHLNAMHYLILYIFCTLVFLKYSNNRINYFTYGNPSENIDSNGSL